MSYRQIRCGKCGCETNGKIAKTINDPKNPKYGLLIDLCEICNRDINIDKTLESRLYPESNPDSVAIDNELQERKERARQYQISKQAWILANPGAPFPDGHS